MKGRREAVRLLLFCCFLLALAGGVAALSSRVPPLLPELIGRVLGDDGAPVAGALVRLRGKQTCTFTGPRGEFRLPGPARRGRVTASKEGFLIGGARAGPALTLRLARLPAEDHDGYEWVSPVPDRADEHRCGNCHAGIYREWQRGGHARSATGRQFRGLYEDLLDQKPLGAGVCAACHAPTADDPDLTQVKGTPALGAHCDFCHKVSGLNDGEVGLAHGRYALRLTRPAPGRGQLFFGPLDDVDRGEDAHSPLYRDSRYCAACHEGVVFGVPVYTTYSEWLASPARAAGRHCQHCHMRPTGKMTNVAPGHGGVERPAATLANHVFWDGGSQEEMLRRSLRLEAALSRGPGASVRLTVRLTASNVGHRVPTGFVDRQLILLVEGASGDGSPVRARTGPTLPAPVGEAMAGRAGRLYARLLRDEAGNAPVPFWRALPEATDTRLSPDVPDVARWEFPAGTERVRVRVTHRRFWAQDSRAKGWPVQDLTVIDRLCR